MFLYLNYFLKQKLIDSFKIILYIDNIIEESLIFVAENFRKKKSNKKQKINKIKNKNTKNKQKENKARKRRYNKEESIFFQEN